MSKMSIAEKGLLEFEINWGNCYFLEKAEDSKAGSFHLSEAELRKAGLMEGVS